MKNNSGKDVLPEVETSNTYLTLYACCTVLLLIKSFLLVILSNSFLSDDASVCTL